ncbi:MAG TPA: hypothetical protein VIJ33_10475 [Solirubrobacteraceae bacterium]
MPAAGIVTIVLAAIAVAAIAWYLILIGNVLRDVSSSLQTVIGAVATVTDRTKPIEPVIRSINKDLASARGVLENLLTNKLGVSLDTPRLPSNRIW